MFVDPRVEACDAWLSKHYRAEHRAIDELFPRVGEAEGACVFAPAPRGVSVGAR